MKTSEDISEISKALLKARKDFKPLVATKLNPFFKSNYADLNDVIKCVDEALSENGIILIQGSGESTKGIKVTQRIIHESGQWIESEMPIPLQKNDAQASGSAMSYGRRYLLSAMMCIACSEDDDDGQGASTPDVRARRDAKSLKAITDKQIKQANDFFTSFEASKDNIEATVDKFSGGRVKAVDAMMTTEADAMIKALNKKHIDQFALEQ